MGVATVGGGRFAWKPWSGLLFKAAVLRRDGMGTRGRISGSRQAVPGIQRRDLVIARAPGRSDGDIF